MMKKLLRYPNKLKAIDNALWLNFKNRTNSKRFGVILSARGDYLVVPIDHVSFEGEVFEKLPSDYRELSYKKIQLIAMDADPLNHWEEIRGLFSVMDGEILRFVLEYKIPLEMFIRFELASRGHDENHRWCGFEKAKKIWLDNN